MEPIFLPKTWSLYKKGLLNKNLSNDIFAGIIVGIVALPLAIAFAVASGVSPDKGLITAVVAGFIISLLGGSRVQIGGPTGAFIVIVYGIIQKYGFDGLIISTILAGIMLITFGLLRLGSILKFFPHPLIVGFTSGIALVIFSTQIKDALGLPIEKLPAEFIAKWEIYFQQLQNFNSSALLITLGTIIITVFSGRLIPKVPGSFIAIIVMTTIVAVFGVQVSTIESVFGSIPSKFSITVPHVEISQLGQYMQPALTIALLGAIESLLSAVVADGMISSNHRSNTELIAQGIANVVTPFFGGIPATGAIARTATNIKNNGRTPIAGIIHAITLLLIMLVFGKWALLIPMPCLAGILIVVSYNMSEMKSFFSILKGHKYDIFILISTFILTVFVDLTVAIEVGVVLSALLFMQRMSNLSQVIPLDAESDTLENYADIPKGVEIFEISGPFFFAAARRYEETLKDISHTSKVVIIRMRHVPFIDGTGLRNLKATIKDLKSRRIQIILSGVQPEVRAELEKGGIPSIIGPANIADNFDLALARMEVILKKQE
ncbi:MAG TPA: SulP family inorganic anion transporter [Prolixibacteraceae bacterium]|nr:SulP family inorganic anion transporter [Prolixibacteraceae bacterium]HPR84744.1 SulP family inorganic anion transporter [Prolixibacteraceae bacterium]